MPPAVINPKNLKDPVDVVTNEDSDDEDVGNDTAEVSEDEDDGDDTAEVSGDEDDDLAGIQGFLNLDMEEDDADAVDIDPESIHKRAYNLKDAVEWINDNEEGSIGFQRIFYDAGQGDMELGARRVLQRVMEKTNISDSEYTRLLINWQMEKMEGVGYFDKNKE